MFVKDQECARHGVSKCRCIQGCFLQPGSEAENLSLKLAFDSMHPRLRHSTCFTSFGAYARVIHNKDNVAAIIAGSLCKFPEGSKLIFLKDYYCQCHSGNPRQFILMRLIAKENAIKFRFGPHVEQGSIKMKMTSRPLLLTINRTRPDPPPFARQASRAHIPSPSMYFLYANTPG